MHFSPEHFSIFFNISFLRYCKPQAHELIRIRDKYVISISTNSFIHVSIHPVKKIKKTMKVCKFYFTEKKNDPSKTKASSNIKVAIPLKFYLSK